MASITIDTPVGAVPGHLAVPTGDGPWPGVVVLHELFGVNDDIRSIADRFASEGYLAFAPDLTRLGNRLGCLVRMMRDLHAGAGESVGRITACRQWLASRGDSTGKVGIAGFCLGGGFAIVMANRGFDVSAAQYAHLPKDLQAAVRGACPVVASYGKRDQTLRGKAATLRGALAEAGVDHDVKEYPQAGHSFMNTAEPPGWMKPVSTAIMHAGYVDSAADDAWQRILAMFGEALR